MRTMYLVENTEAFKTIEDPLSGDICMHQVVYVLSGQP